MTSKKSAAIHRQPFGALPTGEAVECFTLTQANGMSARIIDYGGIVLSLSVPDRKGAFDDVVLGYDTLQEYVKNNPYFGALIGRYGNRIAHARFTLNGKSYALAANEGVHHLHGGVRGFDKVVWKARPILDREGEPALELRYLSRDGEEGYPGNLDVTVVYALTPNGELSVDYTAVTDKDTVVNLTQHSYFNLAGAGNGDVLNHQLMIEADRFTPVDKTLNPSGELRSVRGTPLDFSRLTAIGQRIDAEDEQMRFGGGYDHNYVLKSSGGTTPGLAARVVEPTTGRVMEVFTTEPGMQLYTGNFLDGTIKGKAGRTYARRGGFCLETQHFPDSPNRPGFPTTVLRPGERYRQHTLYRFSAGV